MHHYHAGRPTDLLQLSCSKHDVMKGKPPGTKDAPSIIPRYTKYGSTKQKNIYILHSALLTWKDNIILLTSVNNIPQQLHTHYEHVPQETQKITTAPSSLIICWGQGTLKLPMSFSKFSLCPPLGLPATCCSEGRRCESEVWRKKQGRCICGWNERCTVSIKSCMIVWLHTINLVNMFGYSWLLI